MDTPSHLPTKLCRTCGRTITWRKKWRSTWASVRYCSNNCRHSKPSALDRRIEAAIIELLTARARTASICPSEVARLVAGPGGNWRPLMQPVRRAARRLWAAGQVEITQKNQVVDPSRARGAIRIRRARNR